MGYDAARYEGLVRKTSFMYEGLLGWDREDLQQVLRLRVWIAVEAHDPSRSAISEERFVFGAIRNQIKDLIKSKVRRDKHGSEVYIEDLAPSASLDHGGARDRFEGAYLSTEIGVKDEVILPDVVTEEERKVIALLYAGYRQTEIATLLGCQRRDIERNVRHIRRKLADWDPGERGEVVELAAGVRRALQRAAA